MIIGEQMFGAVDAVAGDPIVTSFIIVGPIVFPHKSYYLDAKRGAVLESPALLLPVYSESSVRALPLARLNAKSVACGYARALGLVGLLIAVVLGIIYYAETPAQRASGMEIVIVAGAIAGVFTLIGAASYALGMRGSKRDARIRQLCNAALGLAADPAQLEQPLALQLSMASEKTLGEGGWGQWRARLSRGDALPPELAPLILLALRARAPTYPNERAELEALTDRVLAGG